MRFHLFVARQQEKVDNSVDTGIVPSQGLVPPKLRISDLESYKISETNYSCASTAAKHSKDMTSSIQHGNSQVRSKIIQRKHLILFTFAELRGNVSVFSLAYSPGFRANKCCSIDQPRGGRLQQDSDSSGALPS